MITVLVAWIVQLGNDYSVVGAKQLPSPRTTYPLGTTRILAIGAKQPPARLDYFLYTVIKITHSITGQCELRAFSEQR